MKELEREDQDQGLFQMVEVVVDQGHKASQKTILMTTLRTTFISVQGSMDSVLMSQNQTSSLQVLPCKLTIP